MHLSTGVSSVRHRGHKGRAEEPLSGATASACYRWPLVTHPTAAHGDCPTGAAHVWHRGHQGEAEEAAWWSHRPSDGASEARAGSAQHHHAPGHADAQADAQKVTAFDRVDEMTCVGGWAEYGSAPSHAGVQGGRSYAHMGACLDVCTN
eukprot:scaffold12059_cov19-Tisochrysis_lutea.AAC.3